MASKKLFGQAVRPSSSAVVPHFSHRDYASPGTTTMEREGGDAVADAGVVSSRRPIIVSRGTGNYPTGDELSGDGDGEGSRKVGSGENADEGVALVGGVDPMEDELLERLEQLAQKTDVITRWADEMYEYVKAIPQSAYLTITFPPSIPFPSLSHSLNNPFLTVYHAISQYRAPPRPRQIHAPRRRADEDRDQTAACRFPGRIQRGDLRRRVHARHVVLAEGDRGAEPVSAALCDAGAG